MDVNALIGRADVGQSLDRWRAHSPMTAPGGFAAAIALLPHDPAGLMDVVRSLIIHIAWLNHYGPDIGAFRPFGRTTLAAKHRLAAITDRDGQDIRAVRAPQDREIGTCRDFALLMCAFLRTKGMPARVRCGFASYFTDAWEDHWVCEYWDGDAARWRLADAQIDDVIRSARGITFDAADVPRDRFLTAGEAWLRCRDGRDDPTRFGNGDTTGLWFMGVDVVRDMLAVNNLEVSDWDRWREATAAQRHLADTTCSALDGIARDPETERPNMTPGWV